MFGSWEIKVSIESMPQKVATAMGKLNETLIGAEYTPIAYLGSQVVNGTNHAVLAEQLIITGKDTKNVVLIIFNEKPGVIDLTLVNIERVVNSGAEFGGIAVDVHTKIPEDAIEGFNKVFGNFVGSNINPFALLATQVTKGTNYIFAAEMSAVVKDPVKKIVIVTVNPMTNESSFVDLFTDKNDISTLGYAFTWLKNGNSSIINSVE